MPTPFITPRTTCRNRAWSSLGARTHTFADYRYFSVAVATTFGATDVNITTPRMRRVVNLHTLLTFVYNSVIVALLASFLIR